MIRALTTITFIVLVIVLGIVLLYAYRAQNPSEAAATRSPVSVSTASARTSGPPSPTASPTLPSPTALVSARGYIVVRQPLANSRVTSPVTISGDASVFEGNVNWRIADTAGRALAEGNTTASAGAPGRGTFTITATYPDPPADTLGFVEVFEVSPRDGTISEIVRVPVVLARK